MSTLLLKTKIAMLEAESRTLRRQAVRQQRRLNEMNIRKRLADGGLSEKQMMRIIRRARGRVVLTEDTAGHREASYPNSLNFKRAGLQGTKPTEPPKPEWFREKRFDLEYMQILRRFHFRPELRRALLAYAFLRGRPYSNAENYGTERRNVTINPKTPAPDWDRVGDLARQYTHDWPQEQRQKFNAWVADATSYRASRGLRDTSDINNGDARENI